MLIYIEYTLKGGEIGKICFDYEDSVTPEYAIDDIPKALNDNGVDFLSYKITEIKGNFNYEMKILYEEKDGGFIPVDTLFIIK